MHLVVFLFCRTSKALAALSRGAKINGSDTTDAKLKELIDSNVKALDLERTDQETVSLWHLVQVPKHCVRLYT